MFKWVIKAVEDDERKPKAEDRALEDEELSHKISERFQGNRDITIGHNYIEFDLGTMNRPHLKFGNHGFREQAINFLRKLNLCVEGL